LAEILRIFLYFNEFCFIIWVYRLKDQNENFAACKLFAYQDTAYLINFFINRIFDKVALPDCLNFYICHYDPHSLVTHFLK